MISLFPQDNDSFVVGKNNLKPVFMSNVLNSIFMKKNNMRIILCILPIRKISFVIPQAGHYN